MEIKILKNYNGKPYFFNMQGPCNPHEKFYINYAGTLLFYNNKDDLLGEITGVFTNNNLVLQGFVITGFNLKINLLNISKMNLY